MKRRAELDPDDVREWRDQFAGLFRDVGDVANARVAPAGSDVWIVDDDDANGVASPAARLVVRHFPVIDSDARDVISLALAFARYLRKQFSKLRDWRAAQPDPIEQPEVDAP